MNICRQACATASRARGSRSLRPYAGGVDPTAAALLGGGVGLVLGAAAVVAARYSELTQTRLPDPAPPALPAGVSDVLAVLRSVAIVLDSSDAVVNTSASAVSYGLVRGGELVQPGAA